MAKEEMLPKEAKEQPGKAAAAGAMPGKMKGDKMPHEVMNDKMAKGLGC